MTLPAAFRGTYADWKLVKTRAVIQVVFEVPLADADAAYDVLGGMPNSANESWFGIAPLKSPPAEKEIETSAAVTPATPRRLDKPAGAKRAWQDTPKPQQAGMCINEPSFVAYLREEFPDEWRETQDADACLKLMCGIASKSELATSHKAGALWFQIDNAYRAWKALERA